MKILFFIESLTSGGKERRLVELIKGLSKDESISMQIVLIQEIIHYKEIHSINIRIDYTKRKFLKKDPRIFYKFYKIAKNYKPDVIHVWGNMPAIYSIPTKILLRTPMINNQISDAPLQISSTVLNHKITFLFSDKIIANSYAGLKTYNAPKNKSDVIYNGFDFSRINLLEDINRVREKFDVTTKLVVGMVASFSKKKDYKTYIEAANKLLKQNFDVTFLCIGSGDDTTYKEMVETENRDRILFLGKQNNVESIMNICDIGVLSTYTEGISNALLEFSALGKPVVTTFGGGNIELVSQEETGYLVDQESPGKLAEKIELLLNDESKRIDFGVKGKERIFKKFSIDKMIANFKDVYAKTI